MTRTQALEIVRRYTDREITYRHLISVEGVMRALADHFDEDVEKWGLAGLFHDLDYDRTQDDLSQHAYKTVEWLKQESFDDESVLNAVLAHRFPEYRTDLLSKTIVHADAVAGLLVACALVRPQKAQGMKVSSVKKKLKEKSFAPGVEREEIHGVEDSIGLPLEDFLATSIGGLQAVADEIELV